MNSILTLFHVDRKIFDEYGVGADSAHPPVTFEFIKLLIPSLTR